MSRNITLGFAAVLGGFHALIGFMLTNKPSNVDFLIATDSEMKKVNWTSRKELIGSTRVVILFVVGIAVVLFVYDLFFHTLFYLLRCAANHPVLLTGQVIVCDLVADGSFTAPRDKGSLCNFSFFE